MSTVCVCSNCGHTSAVLSGDVKCPLYCKLCKTEEQREKMRLENEEIQSHDKKRSNVGEDG